MAFVFRGNHNIPSENDAFYRIGDLLREERSKAAVLKKASNLASHMPIGTVVTIEKVYRPGSRHEHGARWRLGDIVESWRIELIEHGAFFDPKTNKPKLPRWKKLEHLVRNEFKDWVRA